jgi:two-component system cell cycle sensor histidine kinase/response regulator CckA
LTGFSQHELMNVPFTELIHPEDRSQALERYQRRMAGKHLSPEYRFRLLKKDGSFLWVENRTATTTWQDQPATVNFFRDISQQKRMEEMMIRSEKMASLGQLSAGLAHELRNPLAVISSCAQFCMENMDLEHLAAENFQVIYRNSQRASKLISELLAFARPDSLNYKSVDLNQLFERMLRMAKLETDPSHITFVKQLEVDLPEIPGDEEKLGQVCINLIQNAIQAISGKGIITIETRRDNSSEDAMLEISVADNGPGIPLEHRKRIFDPFFTTKDSGTGLGLSICHAVVEQHLGLISFECGEEGGTRMMVKLPVKKEKVTEHRHEQ